MDAVTARFEALESRTAAVEGQLRTWRRIAGFFMAATAVALGVALMPATPVEAQATVEQRLTALEQKLLYVSRSGREMIFNAVNVHIRNGGRSTESTNGLGNLIVGFNERRPMNQDGSDPNLRTGSHNIVVGSQNNHSSYGGLVAGHRNTISAYYASVSGGLGNIASGWYSSVSGGQQNSAMAVMSSVSGGGSNVAGASNTSISGGRNNRTLGAYASVSGGMSNTASADHASVSGGQQNYASGSYSSVSGGRSNTASGGNASASGGTGINQSAPDGWSGGTYLEPGFGIYQGRFRSP